MLTGSQVVLEMDVRSQASMSYACHSFIENYAATEWVPAFVDAFPDVKNAMARKYILHFCIGRHDDYPPILAMARLALSDRSWLVRSDAMAILAYALDQESLALIKPLLGHKDERTRLAAAGATKAIMQKNRNYFANIEGRAVWIAPSSSIDSQL